MSVMDFLYGLIVIALLALAVLVTVLIKYKGRKIRGEWALAGLLIGLLSLPVGLYLAPILDIVTRSFIPEGPLTQIFPIFLLFIILSICYTYLRKESLPFLALTLNVSFFVVLITGIVWFVLSMSAGGHFFYAQKLGYEPEYYIDITPEELENFPLLKEAINKGEYIRADSVQTEAIRNFIREKQEKKYSKRIVIQRTPYEPPLYINETELKLEEFPAIKKAVGELGRIIEVPSNEWQSFRSLVERSLREKDPYFTFMVVSIKIGNEYYLVEPSDLRPYIKVGGTYYEVSSMWAD